MNNKLSLTFILTPTLLLAIWLTNCAQDARAEWEHIPGTEVIGRVDLLESDGVRLYAIGDTGFYLSFDDGSTWRHREIGRGIEDFYMITIGSGDGAVYVVAIDHGVFRSDDGGNTWHPKNKGLALFHKGDPDGSLWYPSLQQILVTDFGAVIAVGYHQGTQISHNRGDSWRDVTSEWKASQGKGSPDIIVGTGIFSMTEFDGYLWAAYSNSRAFRSPDNGETWEVIPYWDKGSIADFDRIHDWAALGDKLYVAGNDGFGHWNEAELMWDNLSRGLPDEPHMKQLAVNRGRIFAAFYRSDRGVWLYDQPSETWFPTGPQHVGVYSLVSHQSDLYAATENGIYRGSIPSIQPHGKLVTTWARVKQGGLSK